MWFVGLGLGCLPLTIGAQPITWTPLPTPGGGWVDALERTPDGFMCAFVGLSATDLFCSKDEGLSWTQYATPSDGRGHIAFSPTGTWYIAGRRLYRSRDQGASWHRLGTASIRFLLVNAEGHVYINGPTTNVFWISKDEGDTWEPASTPGADLYYLSDGAFYTTSSDTLYRRTADGTWVPLVQLPNMGPPFLHPNGTLFVTQNAAPWWSPPFPGGLYRVEADRSLMYVGFENHTFGPMAADDTGRLWVGLAGRCQNHFCGPPAGLFASSNLGNTWRSYGFEEIPVTALATGEDGEVYLGTRGVVGDHSVFPAHGVLRLNPETSNWDARNTGIRKSTIFHLAQTRDDILYTIADRTIARSDDSGLSWQTVYDLATNRVLENYRSIYAEDLFTTETGDVFAYIAPNVLLHSSDDGTSWELLQLPTEGHQGVLIGYSETGVLFFNSAAGSLMRSADKGQTWDPVELGDDTEFLYWRIIQAPAGRLYGLASPPSTRMSTLYTSTDEGVSWTPLTTFDAGFVIQLVTFSPTELYVQFYDDSGADIRKLARTDGTWHLTRLPRLELGTYVNDMLVDPDGTLYVASTNGVARFRDNRWLPLSSSFNAHVHTLNFDRQGYLFAGTRHDGLYKTGPLIATTYDRNGPVIERLRSNYPNPFSETTTIRFFLPEAAHATLTIYDTLGREVDRLLDRFLPLGYHEVKWRPFHVTPGVYHYRLEAGGIVETGAMVQAAP